MHNAWHQLAFERNLHEGLNEVPLATRTIALAKTGGDVRAFDAYCPHRGANLCRGGKLTRTGVICPFHGLHIALEPSGDGLKAELFECLVIGGMVFARHAAGPDRGFAARIAALDQDYYFVPGFEMAIAAPAELIVENAFDALHFSVVHGIGNQPDFDIIDADSYCVTGIFRLPPSPWQGARTADVPYRATAYSPTLVLTELGGDHPYMMLTATVPTGPRTCLVRLSLALPANGGAPPDVAHCRYLLAGAERGLNEDRAIWEGLAEVPCFASLPGDAAVLGFRKFCEGFA